MQQIDSPQDFETMLQADRAAVFIFFAWSSHAVQSQEMVAQWQKQMHQTGELNYLSYELAPDDCPFTWKWMETVIGGEPESQRAHGAVLWLRKGTVVGYIPNAARAGIKTLVRITTDCFVHDKIHTPASVASLQNEPAPFDLDLLKILCCPETHQGLALADAPILDKVNQRFAAGGLQNRAGRPVTEKVAAALIRADGRFLYPLRRNIPILLIDEAIPLPG
jgi:uncharacterized protein YbaR (Trm112 family)